MKESEVFFNNINKMIESNSLGNNKLLEDLELFGIDCNEIPNSAITLNNKVVEIMGDIDKKNASGIEGIVIDRLIGEYKQIIENIEKISDILDKQYEILNKELLKRPNFISKIINRIRSRFAGPKELSDEEKKNIYDILNRIKEKDDYIFNYDLKENIVDDIQRDFDLEGYGAELRKNFEQCMKYIESNIDFAIDFIEKEIPKVKVKRPQATFLLWLDLSSIDMEHEQLDQYLINEGKLLLNSGITYGNSADKFFRMNIACNREMLTDALNRLKNAIDKLN